MSIDLESALNLEHDEAAVVDFLAGHGGRLDRDDLVMPGPGDRAVYWVTTWPRAHPDDVYFVRVEWFSYPYESPSVKFATAIRGSLTDPHAWPVITGYRPQSQDICMPMTREGYGLHPEWRQGYTAWGIDGNPFLVVIELLQFHLDNDYQGRYR